MSETYCPECGASGECPCIGNWRERAAAAEAEREGWLDTFDPEGRNIVSAMVNARSLLVEVERLKGLLIATARVIRFTDGLPCWCADYDSRVGLTRIIPGTDHSPICVAVRDALRGEGAK